MKKRIIFCLLLICFLAISNICYGFKIKDIFASSCAFKRPYWQHQETVVSGTWSWQSAIDLQTNYTSIQNEVAGTYMNFATHADLDEIKWPNIFLTKGTYKITIYHIKSTDYGIAEVLFGTTSLGTKDLYAAAAAYNQLWEITFTLTSNTIADMRFRVNGKNVAAGTTYKIDFSRFQIEKIN